jgi:coenzyme F420-0:L-glutamate ligase / coenzyme F420-1:gamma-L-glutamate ligase
MPSEMRVIGLPGLPSITPGIDLARAILEIAKVNEVPLRDGDIVIVTSKIVSKAEGRLIDLRTITPSAFATQIAKIQDKDERLVEVVLRESRRIVKMDQRTIVAETHHGLVCANAGVDESNIEGENIVAVLPVDPDGSARQLREKIRELAGAEVSVIISDTFGRPWREGLVNVAIGVAGLQPLKDYRGLADTEGRIMKLTALAVADQLASAAELVMGKLDRVPVAIIRGYAYTPGDGAAAQLVRAPEKDLFR